MPCTHRALLTVPDSLAGRDPQAPLRTGLRRAVGALPAAVSLVVAGHRAALAEVLGWPEIACRAVESLLVDDEVDFTLWCQDSFLSVQSADGAPLMLLPAANRRRRDDWLAERTARLIGLPTARAEFNFEGGNILAAGGFVFGGADTPQDSRDGLPAGDGGRGAPRRLIEVGMMDPLPPRSIRLTEGAGGPVVEELHGHAGRRQPIYHLDLFVTPAGPSGDGREIVLVGDSRRACALAGADRLPLDGQSLADALDETAARLAREEGLLVRRNPLPIVPVLDWGLRRWSRSTIARRYEGWRGLSEVLDGLDRRGADRASVLRWRAATQNGCLVFGEPGRGGSVVLPSHAEGRTAFLAPVEEENAGLWRALGYEVRTVPGFMPSAVENGSLHCMYKMLPG